MTKVKGFLLNVLSKKQKKIPVIGLAASLVIGKLAGGVFVLSTAI